MTWWLIANTYVLVGCGFAYKMAISTTAIVTLVLFWPAFLLMIVLAPIVNWYVNRR